MTVTTTANSIRYAGNGTTKAFAFPYIFFAPSDLVVTLVIVATGAAVSPAPVLNGAGSYDYTVTGEVNAGEYPAGATITFNTAPLGTHTVIITRAVPATQTVTLIDNTKFPADTVNAEFDKLTILAQQSTFLGSTALQIPSVEAGLVVTAVPAANRANKLLLWDALGNLSTIDPTTLIGGAVPAGPASGDLAGTYPGPSIKPSVGLTGIPTAPTAPANTNTTQIATTAFVQTVIPPGVITDFAGFTAPTGWLLCNGALVSRTTYANLLAAVTAVSPAVTVTIASPAVFTWASHPLVAGDLVSLETTGALPTGFAVGTNYFVVAPAAGTFQLSTTLGGASIASTGSQSGVHTVRRNPWGCGDGTTTFALPDLGGRVTAGKETTATRLTTAGSGISGATLGAAGGVQTAQLSGAEMPTGTITIAAFGAALTTIGSGPSTVYQYSQTGSTPKVQPTLIMNKIIKA